MPRLLWNGNWPHTSWEWNEPDDFIENERQHLQLPIVYRAQQTRGFLYLIKSTSSRCFFFVE